MHICFCASDYRGAAGHWLVLIIVLFVLSASTLVTTSHFFLNDNLQMAKKKTSLPGKLIVTQKPRIPVVQCANNPAVRAKNWVFRLQTCVVSVLANNLSVAQFWIWVFKKKEVIDELSMRSIRLLDPSSGTLRSLSESRPRRLQASRGNAQWHSCFSFSRELLFSQFLQSWLLGTPRSKRPPPSLVVRRGSACASEGAAWGLSSARRTANSGRRRRPMPCCLCRTARSRPAYCSCWRCCRTACR